jgi:hypothetical protein
MMLLVCTVRAEVGSVAAIPVPHFAWGIMQIGKCAKQIKPSIPKEESRVRDSASSAIVIVP